MLPRSIDMDQYIVIQNISSTDEWRKIFQFVLNYCDHFHVTFPDAEFDAENPLMGGKEEFERLKDLTCKKSTEMDQGIVLSGELNTESAALFEKFMSPAYDGFKPMLWNFQLLKDNETIIEVSDFTVCLLDESAPITHFLERANVDIDSLKN